VCTKFGLHWSVFSGVVTFQTSITPLLWELRDRNSGRVLQVSRVLCAPYWYRITPRFPELGKLFLFNLNNSGPMRAGISKLRLSPTRDLGNLSCEFGSEISLRSGVTKIKFSNLHNSAPMVAKFRTSGSIVRGSWVVCATYVVRIAPAVAEL
jgi:hypothetical protein